MTPILQNPTIQWTEALVPHKEIIETLLLPRIPKKEININVWAAEVAKALNLPFEVAYKRVKSAGRALAEAGAGKYTVGRRGRESRFKAAGNMKDYVEQLLKKAEVLIPEARLIMAEAPSFSQEEFMALKQLLQPASSPEPAQKPALKDLLDGYSAEDILKAVSEKMRGSN